MGNLDATIVAVAFPQMVSHFSVPLVLTGWVLTAYLLTVIGTIPVVSRFSDAVGRRSTFMACLVSFTVGSFLCAIAPGIGWLIFFRVIQAIGGGGFVSAATGIVSDAFPDSRQRFIGLFSTISTLAAIVGPNIGGVMVGSLGWQSVFWVNVPVGVMAMVLALRLIKADTKKAGHVKVDFVGTGLLIGFASAVMIALTFMVKAYHIPMMVIALFGLLGLLFFALFIYWIRGRQDAVVSMELLVGRPFMASNLYNLAFGACAMVGIMSLVPLYATSVYGMSVLESGLVMTPRSFGMMAASIVASFSLLKWGYRRPLIVGTLAVSLGLLALALELKGLTVGGVSVPPIMLVMFFGLIVGSGQGLAAPAANNACIDLMPGKAASITGIRLIARYMGGAIAVAVSTLVLESSADIARGFSLALIGFSLMTLLSIAAVFFMPRSADDLCLRH